jgi:hypothetical protein
MGGVKQRIHETTVCALCERYGLQPKGFRAGVRKVFGAAFLERNIRDRFIPDAWVIGPRPLVPLLGDQDGRESETWEWITCVEVEDANPISANKLTEYCDAWFDIDADWNPKRPIDFALVVSDRWGTLQRIDLCRYWYHHVLPQHP